MRSMAAGVVPAAAARWASSPAPSDAPPTSSAIATITSSESSVRRGRGWTRNRRAACACASGASLAAPVEAEPDLADLELVAEPERRDAARPARR